MMSYRRKKQESIDKRRYEDFRRDNATLIAKVGIPYFIMDDHDHFMYYLEHGYAKSDAPMKFYVSRSDAQRYDSLKLLIEMYYKAGFSTLGIMLSPDEVNALAEKYQDRT